MIKIDLILFPCTVLILKNKKDFKKLKKEYKIKIKFNDNFSDGLCYNFNHYQVIYLKYNNIPILIHELSHATNNIMEFIGENSNSETFAYVMQYLTENSLKELTKY